MRICIVYGDDDFSYSTAVACATQLTVLCEVWHAALAEDLVLALSQCAELMNCCSEMALSRGAVLCALRSSFIHSTMPGAFWLCCLAVRSWTFR